MNGFLWVLGIVALSVIGLIALVGIVVFVRMLPDMKRYMRVKRM